MIQSSLFLRRALYADAIVSGATGVLLVTATGPLATLLDLPFQLLLSSGLFFVPYAAFVGWLGACAHPPRVLIWAVIIGNAGWTLASVALLIAGPVTPNLLGSAFIAMQAIAVGVFAELQYIGLRKSSAQIAI